MAHTIGIILFWVMALMVITSIIGTLVFLTRKNLVNGKNKIIVWIIGILQVSHIMLYFTNSLSRMVESDVYVAFAVCVFLSLTCLLLSLWLVLPFARFRNATKYLFTFLAVIQVWTTYVIFFWGIDLLVFCHQSNYRIEIKH